MVNLDISENKGVLGYLRRPDKQGKYTISQSLAEVCGALGYPYWIQGSHPEVVQRLWDELTVKLPEDCRWLVYGSPSLVHPSTGIVFGFATGTSYALRLIPETFKKALKRGAQTIYHYPGAPEIGMQAFTIDLSKIGDYWIIGNWKRKEKKWCLETYHLMAKQKEPGKNG